MRIIKIALIFVLLLMFLQNVSANFVCGEVESNENYLPIWMNVIVYYESNPEEVTNCKINSEQKFCCDLWDIKSVSFAKDKKVFAEVFDLESGFVSNPVSLITTSEGFSVFPTLKIEKAIKISDFKKIIINEDSVFLNISLNERYNNLKYSVNSSEGFFERDLCSDCLKYEFYADVSRGKNEITLIAYNFDGEVEENFEVYSLDYLNLERKIDCGKCRKNNYFIVPANEIITVSLFLEASHEFSGNIVDYFPVDFEIQNSSQKKDYSNSHNSVEFSFYGKETSFSYILKSPSLIIPKTYIFKSDVYGFEKEDKVRVTRIMIWPSFFYFNAIKEETFFNEIFNKAGPESPMIINPENSKIELIAIYPKGNKINLNFILDSSKKLFQNEEEFNILTTLSESEIEKILVRVKSEKDKIPSLISSEFFVEPEKNKELEGYVYYDFYIKTKKFKIKIN